MAQIPQYKMLIRTSSGALHRDRLFLMRKRWGERVRSESRPKMKVRVDIARPMMVRNWKCQPYASFMKLGNCTR